jgi:hypothetical protein
MINPHEPTTETAHTILSPREVPVPTSATESQKAARIHLPTRPLPNPPPVPADAPSPLRAGAGAMRAPITSTASKTETAIPSRQSPEPAAHMKKAQPLIDLPAVEKHVAPVTITAEPKRQSRIETISMPLCWAVLAGSVAILILQIWNYFS